MDTTTSPPGETPAPAAVGAHFSAEAPGRASIVAAVPAWPRPEPWWRRGPRVAFECTAMLIGYLAYGGLGLLVNAVCWPLSLSRLAGRRSVARRCQRFIHRVFALFVAYWKLAGIVRVEFRAGETETLRALRGAIIAPNHPCLLDAVFLISRLPRVTCVMKKAVLRNPVMGGTARLAGYLCNDSGPNFIRRCRDALRAGDCLLLFPEGTRTVAPPVNPFKKGFALVATLAAAPVQTVFIETPTNYLGKRWSILRKPTLPVRFTVSLGRRFQPAPGQSAKAFSDELEAYFREMLEPDAAGVKRRASDAAR